MLRAAGISDGKAIESPKALVDGTYTENLLPELGVYTIFRSEGSQLKRNQTTVYLQKTG